MPNSPDVSNDELSHKQEHNGTEEHTYKKRIIKTVLAGIGVVYCAEQFYLIKQPIKAAERLGGAEQKLLERLGQPGRFEILAIDLCIDFPFSINESGLGQVVKTFRGGKIDKAGIARQALYLIRLAAQNFPILIADILLTGKGFHRLWGVAQRVEADGNYVKVFSAKGVSGVFDGLG